MMKRLSLFTLAFFLFLVSNSILAQDPYMTGWVSDAANQTEIQLRTQYYSIIGGYSLVEVSFSMSAARCALTDEVRIYIYQNNGSGSYGAQRYATSFDPGPGTVPISTSDKTRILISETISIDEPIYARAVISGVSASDDFILTTPDCLTRLRTSDAYDPNEDYTIASAITSGTTHEYLLANNDEDWYPVTITSGNPRLAFNITYWNDYLPTESNLDLDLFLAGSTGSIIASSTSSTISTSSRVTETIDEILDPGTYYMVVRPKDTDPNRNFYTLNWDAYAAPTYQISGRITNGVGSGESGITLNGFPESVVTDADGYYSGTVPYNWSGTIIPASTSLIFSPVSYVYSEVRANVTDQDFTASLRTYSLAGNVVTIDAVQLEGASMGGLPGSVVTNAFGVYIAEVEHGWSGTITPSLAGYTFSPVSLNLTNVTSSQTLQDFWGTLNTYEISGTLTLPGGSALPGVTLSGLPGDPVTDVNGDYSVLVDHGWSGTVTPTLTGYTFDPVSSSYSSISAAQVQDYTGTLNTYEISGIIRDGSNMAVPPVTLSGLPGNPVTDGTGYYSVMVDHGWSGTVTPTLAGYTFDPVSMVYSNVTSDQSQNYTATINIYQIDGYVRTEGGAGIAGVMMLGLPTNPSTNAEGYYSGPVNYGRNITVTPTLDGYAFTPSSTDYFSVAGNATTDYVGTPGPYLNTSQHIILFTSEAGVNDQVSVTSNVDWTVSCPESWITCSPASGSDDGSFTITANSANTSTADRNATVTVAGEGLSREIYVTQAGSDPFLEVSAPTLTLGAAAASSQSADVTSNIAWTVSETADWLSVTPVSGSGNGSLIFTADLANEAVDERSTTVVVSGGGFTRNIDVTQSGTGNILEVSSTNVTFSSGVGAGQTVAITSNIAWTASETSDWLTVSPLSGSNDGVITISATSANEQVDPRTATVTVAGGGINHVITVTQAGEDPVLEVSPATVAFNSEAGTYIDASISSNISWTVSENADWLSVSTLSGSGNASIRITSDSMNSEPVERSTSITVEGSGIVRNITVTQAAAVNTGMDDLFGQIKLELYPNPARERVFLKSDAELKAKVRLKLMSISGQILYEVQLPCLIPGQPVEIDLSVYPVGQYLIQIENDYIQRVFKVIKL